jgi:putative thiamine transport system permease protein
VAPALQQLTPLLRWLPGLTLLLFLGPVAAGLLGTVLPAFGFMPALGGERFSLETWRRLLDAPGLATAVRVSITSGFVATALALALTVLAFAAGHGTRPFLVAKRAMTPLLAMPHVAVAVGLAFLIAPSGWLARLVSPWLTGWQAPPDLATVQDPHGLALTLGLVVKETPFLFLMTFAALGQVRANEQLRMARSLGYGPAQAWLKVVLPQVYPQIRLPLYAVLAYSLSVVDMALVLGPTTPPPLAPMVLRWLNDPDLSMRFVGTAGAVLQFLVVVLAIAAWRGFELLVAWLVRPWLAGGRRGAHGAAKWLASAGLLFLFGLALGSLLALAAWSVAGSWRYPEAWPGEVSSGIWAERLDMLAGPAWTTLTVGLASAAIALVLVAGCLENEARRQRSAGRGALMMVYLPLLVPQVGFLFGVQVLLVAGGMDGTWGALVWAHLLFVLPYVFLALSDPYRSLDPRFGRSALALGKPPLAVWFRIKLPLLLRPVLIAAAIGFAVSVAQYLPTLFAGGGRLSTLTTEAVSLAAGGDRRTVGMFAFTLAVLPLLGFGLAVGAPAWRFRHRRAMQVGT